MIAKNLVRKIESLNAFVATDQNNQESITAFLVCKKCMKAKKIPLNAKQIGDLFLPLGVSSGDIRIEAFGDCEVICLSLIHI